MTTAHRVDYRWLAQVYESVQPAGTSDALLWQRLGAKTLDLVHGHITEVRVTGSGLDEVIVDAETIEAIRQLALPDPGVQLDDEPMTVKHEFSDRQLGGDTEKVRQLEPVVTDPTLKWKSERFQERVREPIARDTLKRGYGQEL